VTSLEIALLIITGLVVAHHIWAYRHWPRRNKVVSSGESDVDFNNLLVGELVQIVCQSVPQEKQREVDRLADKIGFTLAKSGQTSDVVAGAIVTCVWNTLSRVKFKKR